MFGKIGDAVSKLQLRAAKNIFPYTPGEEIRGFNPDAMQDLTICVEDTIRFVYTIEKHPQGLVHIISSQLCKPKSKKYHVQCMLVVMASLLRQIGDAGINQNEVKFEITESDLGTQYVNMLVSLEHQEKLDACAAKTAEARTGASRQATLGKSSLVDSEPSLKIPH
ncbi:MAG TPA: hypothetical protein PK280_03290 [Planctomycetota bacterium]|nr:hypothetical protein [Planctomycetota bacterium]